MTQQGKYDPSNTAHCGTLFSYGEVPLTSLKLNRWDGNLATAIDFLTEAAVTLFGGWAEDFVLPGISEYPLKVVEQSVPDMTVSVNAGRCIVSRYFAGIDEDQTLPPIWSSLIGVEAFKW